MLWVYCDLKYKVTMSGWTVVVSFVLEVFIFSLATCQFSFQAYSLTLASKLRHPSGFQWVNPCLMFVDFISSSSFSYSFPF